MPLYEYACQECGEQSELLIRSGEEPDCPKCGSGKLARLLSIVAAPTRGESPARGKDLPSGPCSSSCACFPSG
jgi:putative FmdB family regulatory protein